MSRRILLYVIGFVLVAGSAALAVLPARWIMAALPSHLPLAVVNASGTIWSGTATVALGTPERRRSVAEPVRWQFALDPGPRLRVSHPWLRGPVTLSLGWRGIGISAQTLQLPATALGALDARIAAIDPGGELSLKWPATFIGLASRTAGARLLDMEWRNAVSALAPVRPLGDYALALKQGAPGQADVLLSTRQGPLMLNGAGILSRKQFQFDGTAQADPSAGAEIRTALRDLLAALGPQQNDVTLLRFR
ncbi:type II secretion system protein N [Allopusillimonas ginsengisoli]|uniref:type II secretion system protein N n=1 Tax=Allopusillimonas ginsengisoli TaxID=453575 RepID=UPI0010212668|nr:type II secretion system protein N [Allopusillimonas ginsengisoli]TEA80026.1 general secretion pathway protein GspN [Allopusillimonas ginsengisoli]